MERRIETIGRRRLDADASAAIAERWPFLQLVSLLYFFPIVSVFFYEPSVFFLLIGSTASQPVALSVRCPSRI